MKGQPNSDTMQHISIKLRAYLDLVVDDLMSQAGVESLDELYLRGERETYLVHCAGTGCIKVGMTRIGVKRRMQDLQTGTPLLLEAIGTLPFEWSDCSGSVEGFLHEVLSNLGLRVRGEWFKLTVDDAVYLLDAFGGEVLTRKGLS